MNPTFVDVLGKPLTGIVASDRGNLPTVAVKSLLERHVLPHRAEPLCRTNVLGQLAAEVIVEMPACEAREEIVSHNAKLKSVRSLAEMATRSTASMKLLQSAASVIGPSMNIPSLRKLVEKLSVRAARGIWVSRKNTCLGIDPDQRQ
jgi:hypothetical protein